jgi:hypothetical protein
MNLREKWWYLRCTYMAIGLLCCISMTHAGWLDSLKSMVPTPDVVPMPPNADQIDPYFLANDCDGPGRNYSLNDQQWALCHQILAARMPPIDPKRRQWFGKEYSPKKYWECRKKAGRGQTDCERYRLVRNAHPEYWPYPDVPPVKWPAAPNPPTWQSGMSGKEYFQALCEREAGWFIYRTIEGVEGLYIVRPRGSEDADYHLADPYVVEDPWAMTIRGWVGAGDDAPGELIQPPYGPYQFVETKRRYDIKPESLGYGKGRQDGPDYYRFFRNPSRNSGLTEPIFEGRPGGHIGQIGEVPYIVDRQPIQQATARYGFTWREIERPQMRENGIVGGELVVLDLKTNEVLGVRRMFMTNSSSYIRGGACQKPGKSDKAFISSVLKPKQINNK